MEYFLMGIAVVVIIMALMYFKKFFFPKKNNENKKSFTNSFVNCPVCGSPLFSGQNLFSKVFRSTATVSDQLCYVYGCPNCYPVCKNGIKRMCPVCHKEVGQNSFLISRMFNKTKSGKPHVIINGCGNCNRHNK